MEERICEGCGRSSNEITISLRRDTGQLLCAACILYGKNNNWNFKDRIFKPIPKIKDYIGKTFNDLTILEFSHSNEHGNYVKCRCICGNTTTPKFSDVINNQTKSCGCLQVKRTINNKYRKKYNTYNLEGEYGIGYTSKGEEFYFDLEDYDKIKEHCWYINDSGYVLCHIKNKNIRFHRFIFDIQDSKIEVDHIFHNLIDNRKENLRIVSSSDNSKNIRCQNILNIKGITWDICRKKWITHLTLKNGISFRLRFDCIKDAINKRIELEKEYFKEHRYIWENNIKWDLIEIYENKVRNEEIPNKHTIKTLKIEDLINHK
jgi:hypothetical protein